MEGEILLHTPHLILSPLHEEHAAALLPLWSDPEVVRYLVCPRKFTVRGCRRWILRLLEKECQPNVFAASRNGEIIGVCGSPPLERDVRGRGLHYQFLRSTWGNGYGREAAAALLEFVFSTTEARYVETAVVEYNEPSIRVLQGIGMRQTGLRTGAFFKGGRRLNELVFTMNAKEYAAKKENGENGSDSSGGIQPEGNGSGI